MQSLQAQAPRQASGEGAPVRLARRWPECICNSDGLARRSPTMADASAQKTCPVYFEEVQADLRDTAASSDFDTGLRVYPSAGSRPSGRAHSNGYLVTVESVLAATEYAIDDLRAKRIAIDRGKPARHHREICGRCSTTGDDFDVLERFGGASASGEPTLGTLRDPPAASSSIRDSPA